ncbi:MULTISPECIES: hypothetical protein [Paenibacillus]
MFKKAKGSLWIGLILAISLVFTGCAGKEKTDEEKTDRSDSEIA